MTEQYISPLSGIVSVPGPTEQSTFGFFDGMLMYGWLADNQRKIMKLNKSLENWMKQNGLSDFLEEINRGEVSLKDFLLGILQDPSEVISDIVERSLEDITNRVQKIPYPIPEQKAHEYQVDLDDSESEYSVQKIIRFADGYRMVLAGVRVVKPGAIRLKSDRERDRIDLISVCQISGGDCGWKVDYYQGQLQQAWLRVKAVIRANTQAGTVGLMGRNVSHNIGSHALFYLEVDEEVKSRKSFYRYLRERMELLAGFATTLPLSVASSHLHSVLENFKDNKDLLERIARSELVSNVNIEYSDIARDVALPGGVLGAQALYAILENNIRDSAKHARSAHSNQEVVNIYINAREPDKVELKDDFIEITISDDRENYGEAHKQLQEALDKLRIVDDMGSLDPNDWGIKERFIAAAMLRGIRLENIPIQWEKDGKQLINLILGSYETGSEPKILSIKNVDGNLGWVFYLMKPKEILLISDNAGEPPEELRDIVTVKRLDWLKKNIGSPSKIRHRFVVLCPESQDDLDEWERQADMLPYRVFVRLKEGINLSESSKFVTIDEESLTYGRLSSITLYRKWIERLVEQKYPTLKPVGLKQKLGDLFKKKRSNTPSIVFQDRDMIFTLTLDEQLGKFNWGAVKRKAYRAQGNVNIGLFDSHGALVNNLSADGKVIWEDDVKNLDGLVINYEPHMDSDHARHIASAITSNPDKNFLESATGFALIEAALTKVLIVDERLDPTSEDSLIYHSVVWRCSYKRLFELKGIDIRGREYSVNIIPGKDELIQWVRNKGYDFMLLHKGISDKLTKKNPAVEESLYGELKKHVRHLVIHSGRMAMNTLPAGVKFTTLSNVDTWIKNNHAKVQIVEDLYSLRRSM